VSGDAATTRRDAVARRSCGVTTWCYGGNGSEEWAESWSVSRYYTLAVEDRV